MTVDARKYPAGQLRTFLFATGQTHHFTRAVRNGLCVDSVFGAQQRLGAVFDEPVRDVEPFECHRADTEFI